MSPERDDYDEDEEEEYDEEEEEAPRSIFANPWFRAALVVLILAVVAVLALPYVQEYLSSSSRQVARKPSEVPAAKPPAGPPARLAPSPPPAPAGAPEAPASPPAPVAPAAPPPPPAATVAEKPAAPAPAAPALPAPAPAPGVAGKPAEARAPAPEKPAEGPAAMPGAPPSKGDYWVQVGAFTDAKNAARLVARLKDQKFSVQQATVTRGSSGPNGANEVFVAGAKQRDVYDKVRDKGYRVDQVKGGAAVRPALPLRDAVALSKELADAGMDVKIRRVAGGKARVHLVRVGGFPDRRDAEAAQKDLTAKGISGFIVKGAPR